MKLLSKKPNIRFAEDVPTSGAQLHRVTGGGALDRRHRPPSAILLERAPMGLDDYEAQVEPEFVWWTGVECFEWHPAHVDPRFETEDVHECFITELGALRQRLRELAHPQYVGEVGDPVCEPLDDAIHEAREQGMPLILLDDEGKELRRWEL